MGVSIIDIAILAGVSKSTVSAVINNHSNVRPQTRDKVLKAINQLDYHPNIAARELITATPMNIGVLVPCYSIKETEKANRYFNSIGEGSNLELASKLFEHVSHTKYGLLVERLAIDEAESKLPNFALSKRVAGVFQISSILPNDYISRLREYVPNIVDIGTFNKECDCVYTDFEEIVKKSVSYLKGLGHKKIAFVNCDTASRSAASRFEGYLQGLKANNLKFNKSYVSNATYNGEGGYNAFAKIWQSSDDKPTAVICASSLIAGGALRFMNENGISVPQDISIVSNGDSVISEFVYPRLTSISRDKGEVAESAFKLMMERLENNDLPVRAIKTKIHIVKRDSVKQIGSGE